MRAALLLVLLACAGMARAEAIGSSPRPMPNPAHATAVPAAAEPEPSPEAVIAVSLRPRPRPGQIAAMVAAAAEGSGGKGLDLAAMAPEPDELPPPKKKKKSRADRAKERETASKKGSVCGVAAIKGEKIAPIRAKVKGCGLKDGVRVTSVSGVRLSQAATIDCATAKALDTWVREVLQPAYGGHVVELRVAAHYICRPRNNRKGAKVSEHGRGKAIDIAGIVLDSGTAVMVLGGYDRRLRKVHKGACGIFGTTLGPGSDGYHEDHLHFDTADSRSGAYCR